MSLTYSQAVDEMLTVFKTAWDTTTWDAFYQSVKVSRGSSTDPWAIVTIKHAIGFQATLSGVTGSKTFRRQGELQVKIFTAIGKGLQEFYNLAKVVSDGFEGSSSPNGVWFRNVRINEIGRDGEFSQNTVIVDFQYDEIK